MATAEYPNLPPRSTVVALLHDFGRRLAQEKDPRDANTQRQQAVIDGCLAKLSESERTKRSCKHCGKRLASWNKSGYCARHHRLRDRVEPRFCKEPGCGKRLRSDNTFSEFCLDHRWEKNRPSVARFCKKADCGRALNANNKSGYCLNHHHLSRQDPSTWKPCKEPGCGNRLLATSKSDYCGEHRSRPASRPSVKPKFCKAVVRGEKCTKQLRSDNEHGYCKKHNYLWLTVERKSCKEPGCVEILGNNNKSGYCPVHFQRHYAAEHRSAQKKRTAEYRVRLMAKLAEAWRPEGWQRTDADKKMIAILLIEHPGIQNRKLGKILDRARLIKCPYGKDGWEAALSGAGSAANFLSDIRKWVKRPGKTLDRKTVSITPPFTF